MHPIRRSQLRRRRAFTLIELLVVIGIIALLIGILVPTLGRARQQAMRVKASSDLRELLNGYLQYQLSNRGNLLWGYTPIDGGIDGGIVAAFLRDGTTYYDELAHRYPWRLSRYVGNMMQILWSHHAIPQPSDPGDPEAVHMARYYQSIRPAFGLNTVFLGGHAGIYGGFRDTGTFFTYTDEVRHTQQTVKNYVPNTGKHVAFKASEIRRSASQIVFTEVRVAPSRMSTIGSSDADDDGYFFTFPPRADSARADTRRLWAPSADGLTAELTINGKSLTGGLPNTRYGKKNGTLVGFFDGHVAAMTPRELDDMRLWCPKADRADWTYSSK